MRDAIRAYKRLKPREKLPHPMQQMLDNHEHLYWTVYFAGVASGVGICMYVLKWLGRLC